MKYKINMVQQLPPVDESDADTLVEWNSRLSREGRIIKRSDQKCIHGKPIVGPDGMLRGFTNERGTGFSAAGLRCHPCRENAKRNGHNVREKHSKVSK